MYIYQFISENTWQTTVILPVAGYQQISELIKNGENCLNISTWLFLFTLDCQNLLLSLTALIG
jgi:hypothetical protein